MTIHPTTGWRRLIGCPKLQSIFHKRATKYRSLLQKMNYKDKGSYVSSPPCSVCSKTGTRCSLNLACHKIYETKLELNVEKSVVDCD